MVITKTYKYETKPHSHTLYIVITSENVKVENQKLFITHLWGTRQGYIHILYTNVFIYGIERNEIKEKF